MRILILLFAFASCAISYHIPRVRPFRMKLTPFMSLSLPATKTLVVVPKPDYKESNLVNFVQEWGKRKAETGSAIAFSATTNGAEFKLIHSDVSFLAISVVEKLSNISIEAKESTNILSPHLSSLIHLTASTLMDSLCRDLSLHSPMKDPLSKHLHDSTVDITELVNDDFSQSVISDQCDVETLSAGTTHSHIDDKEATCKNKKKQLYVFSWKDPKVDYSSAVWAVQKWAGRYRRGANLYITDTEAGVQIIIPNDPKDNDICLLITAETHEIGEEQAIRVISKMELVPAVNSVERSGLWGTEGLSAAENLIDSLRKELSKITPISLYSNSDENSSKLPISPTSAANRATNEFFEIPLDSSDSIFKAMKEAENARKQTSSQSQSHNENTTPSFHPQEACEEMMISNEENDIAHNKAHTNNCMEKQRQQQQRRRDPAIERKAAAVGVRLESFEGSGLEDQAVKELNALLKNSRKEGFLSVIRNYEVSGSTISAQTAKLDIHASKLRSTIDPNTAGFDLKEVSSEGRDSVKDMRREDASTDSMSDLFERGRRLSELSLDEILSRPLPGETVEDLRSPTPKLPIRLDKDNKGERVDIFQSPTELRGESGIVENENDFSSSSSNRGGRTEADPSDMQSTEAAAPDPHNLHMEQLRLSTLLDELEHTPPEMQENVLDGYRDLMLSDNILFLLKRANVDTEIPAQRQYFQKITEKVISLTAELGALVQTESAKHLQTIQDICQIAAELQHDEEKFLDRLEYIKPRFDTALLGFLDYEIGEECTRMRQNGVDPSKAPTDWLQILCVVQQGVIAEFEKRYRQLLEMLILAVRFEEPVVRSDVFKRFVAITPPMELPYFKALAMNMVEGVLAQYAAQCGNTMPISMTSGTSALHANPLPVTDADLRKIATTTKSTAAAGRGARPTSPFSNAPGLSPTNRIDSSLAQRMVALRSDVDLHLSDAYIRDKMRIFQEQARDQGTQVIVRHRNPVVQAERDTTREIELSQ